MQGSRVKLPPELEAAVDTIVAAVLALAARAARPGGLEQGFEFPWGILI